MTWGRASPRPASGSECGAGRCTSHCCDHHRASCEVTAGGDREAAGPVIVLANGTAIWPGCRYLAALTILPAGRGDLDGDVGGLEDGHGEHSRFQAELVGSFAAEQRYDPVRPGLDLDLGHHGVADDAGDQAAEPVARRVGNDLLAGPVIGSAG